jgi:hypothetical protein
MHHDETTTPWRGPGYSNSGATRSGKVASRDSGNPGDGALSFSPYERQTLSRRSRP